MRQLIIFLTFLPFTLLAGIHYAKVEPYISMTLKSATSGYVLEVDLASEGKVVEGKRIIHIDDTLDKLNLHTAKSNLDILKEMRETNQQMIVDLESQATRLQAHYKRMNALSVVSKAQKNSAYSAHVNAKTQYLSTKEKILSLDKQIIDTEYHIAQLQETIAYKSIILKGEYLYSLLVRRGDYVAPGTPLAKVEDVSKAKLVLFLEAGEVENITERKIYVDDKPTEYKVAKVWRVADEKFISSYRAEIYIPTPKEGFSKLMKVEIR
jgi:multidrug resistance efflux pump